MKFIADIPHSCFLPLAPVSILSLRRECTYTDNYYLRLVNNQQDARSGGLNLLTLENVCKRSLLWYSRCHPSIKFLVNTQTSLGKKLQTTLYFNQISPYEEKLLLYIRIQWEVLLKMHTFREARLVSQKKTNREMKMPSGNSSTSSWQITF